MRARAAVVVAAAFALTASVSAAAGADGIDTHTDVGLLGAVVTGTHVGSENPNPVSGVVPGALLELTQHVDRFRLHLEGLPQISAKSSTTGAYGSSSASLSLLNATALVDLGAARCFRAGFGFQIVNVTNFNGANANINDSRVTSPIYALGATLPAPHGHFFELNLMVDPNLRGVVDVFHNGATSEPNKPEAGAEVDYSAAYGWTRGKVTYLAGARGLSYHTRDLNTDALVDRNVGGGVTFEVRFAL